MKNLLREVEQIAWHHAATQVEPDVKPSLLNSEALRNYTGLKWVLMESLEGTVLTLALLGVSRTLENALLGQKFKSLFKKAVLGPSGGGVVVKALNPTQAAGQFKSQTRRLENHTRHVCIHAPNPEKTMTEKGL